MNNVLSYLTTVKEVVGGKKLSEEPSPEDTEIYKIQIYHDALAHRILQGYADEQRNLLSRLVEVEDCRQKKLQAAAAVVKRRVLKIQHKAEREADPAKMKVYIAKLESARKWRENKMYKECDRRTTLT
jgi:hypothetical protein